MPHEHCAAECLHAAGLCWFGLSCVNQSRQKERHCLSAVPVYTPHACKIGGLLCNMHVRRPATLLSALEVLFFYSSVHVYQAIEALMLEVEKRVRGFHRMQGQTLKGIYSRLSDFRPGGARQLKPAFFAEANRIVDKLKDSGILFAKAGDELTSKGSNACCSCCDT